MNKYCIGYRLVGMGSFFVEASSVALAYEKMYQTFRYDNSLIVYARYDSGFEIISSLAYTGDLPKKPKHRVTTSEELRAARFRDTLDVVEDKKPDRAASADLLGLNAILPIIP